MFGLAPIHILRGFVLSVAFVACVAGTLSRRHRPLLGLAALLAAVSACYLPPVFAFFKAYPAAFWVFYAALLLPMWVARYRQLQRMEMEGQKNQP